MYNPIIETIREAIRELGVGFVVKTHFLWPAPEQPLYSTFGEGDILIYISGTNAGLVPWHTLFTRGVYTIFYNTEPWKPHWRGCTPKFGPGVSNELSEKLLPVIHEVWTYSWKNLHECRKSKYLPPQLQLRYIPPGFLRPKKWEDPSLDEGKGLQRESLLDVKDTLPLPPMNWSRHSAGFLGTRGRLCLGTLMERSLEKLTVLDYAFLPEEAAAVVASYPIQISVHHTCQESLKYKERDMWAKYDCFEAVRASQVLSAHGYLLSERSYKSDEAPYSSIVEFADLESIPSRIQELSRLSATEIQQMTDERYEIFKDRFKPANIFKRAGADTKFLELYHNKHTRDANHAFVPGSFGTRRPSSRHSGRPHEEAIFGGGFTNNQGSKNPFMR
jgi:hypothetical protein